MNNNLHDGSKITVKPYSVRELADIYSVTPHTVNTWLKPFGKEIGQRYGRYFTAKQIKVIFKNLGLPSDHAE